VATVSAFLLARWRKSQAGQGGQATPTMTQSEGASDWRKDGLNNLL
jgi:hypothetical protein